MKEKFRVVECVNPNCSNYGVGSTVFPKVYGNFYDWPNLKCICDSEPEIIATEAGPIN